MKYYQNEGVVFSGDPEDDYEMLIDYLYEDLQVAEAVMKILLERFPYRYVECGTLEKWYARLSYSKSRSLYKTI